MFSNKQKLVVPYVEGGDASMSVLTVLYNLDGIFFFLKVFGIIGIQVRFLDTGSRY